VTKPQRHWAALIIPTHGDDLEEVEVDAATEREAREKAARAGAPAGFRGRMRARRARTIRRRQAR